MARPGLTEVTAHTGRESTLASKLTTLCWPLSAPGPASVLASAPGLEKRTLGSFFRLGEAECLLGLGP